MEKLIKKKKKKNDVVICTKHLTIAKKNCPFCKEGKKKVKGGF